MTVGQNHVGCGCCCRCQLQRRCYHRCLMCSVLCVSTVEALTHSFNIDHLIGFSASSFHQTTCRQCGGGAIPTLQVYGVMGWIGMVMIAWVDMTSNVLVLLKEIYFLYIFMTYVSESQCESSSAVPLLSGAHWQLKRGWGYWVISSGWGIAFSFFSALTLLGA